MESQLILILFMKKELQQPGYGKIIYIYLNESCRLPRFFRF